MLDLFCGRGGWTKGFMAHGFECYGFDIEEKFRQVYPGNFIQVDIGNLNAADLHEYRPKIICASSPCGEFSVYKMPWTRRRNPPEPSLGLKLANKAFEIAKVLGVPLIFENVRTAQRWLGPAVMHCGAFYLWGDGVPALVPRNVERRFKGTYSSEAPEKRAEIPFELADWIARVWK